MRRCIASGSSSAGRPVRARRTAVCVPAPPSTSSDGRIVLHGHAPDLHADRPRRSVPARACRSSPGTRRSARADRTHRRAPCIPPLQGRQLDLGPTHRPPRVSVDPPQTRRRRTQRRLDHRRAGTPSTSWSSHRSDDRQLVDADDGLSGRGSAKPTASRITRRSVATDPAFRRSARWKVVPLVPANRSTALASRSENDERSFPHGGRHRRRAGRPPLPLRTQRATARVAGRERVSRPGDQDARRRPIDRRTVRVDPGPRTTSRACARRVARSIRHDRCTGTVPSRCLRSP